MAEPGDLGGYELLGRYLSIFNDRVEYALDDKLMSALPASRAYAHAPEKPVDNNPEPKSN